MELYLYVTSLILYIHDHLEQTIEPVQAIVNPARPACIHLKLSDLPEIGESFRHKKVESDPFVSHTSTTPHASSLRVTTRLELTHPCHLA